MACQKIPYATEIEANAKRIVLRRFNGSERRYYYCKECPAWHLTHQRMIQRIPLVNPNKKIPNLDRRR